jgi:hypothetical protein
MDVKKMLSNFSFILKNIVMKKKIFIEFGKCREKM